MLWTASCTIALPICGSCAVYMTIALTNATLPYAVENANKGWEKAGSANLEIKRGFNMVDRLITYKGVSDAFDLEYTPVESVIHG